MRFYSVKNRFTDSFNTPFPVENDAMAIYTTRMMINQQHDPAIIPEDYSLYFVGEFDPSSGTFTGEPRELIDDCTKLVRKKEVNNE